MKVNIGPYLTWWGPFQIADLLKYVGVSEDTCYALGSKLKEIKFVNSFLEYVYAKRTRKVNITIHKYDTWSMDGTLALIILPMLKQLKDTKHGSPYTDYEDGPTYLPVVVKDDYSTDENLHKRWEWILDEIIWAFEQKQPNSDWESAFHHGIIDWNLKGDTMEYGDKHTHYFDREGYDKYQKRISNGLKLFGKYYCSLWD